MSQFKSSRKSRPVSVEALEGRRLMTVVIALQPKNVLLSVDTGNPAAVLATPHFTVTDADGRFRLEGLPPGHYVLKAWVDSKTTRETPVDLAADGTVHVDFP